MAASTEDGLPFDDSGIYDDVCMLSEYPEDHKKSAVAIDVRADSRARGESVLLNDPLVSDEDANELILEANRVPDESNLSFDEIMRNIKERRYYQEQFANIQGQAGMNPRTLKFLPAYEAAYAAYIQRDSLHRTRFCFFMGAAALSFYLWYDAQQPSYQATANMHFWTFESGNVTRKDMLDVLSILGPAAFLFGICLTIVPCFVSRFRLERLTFAIFGTVALTLILRKPVGRYKGPVLPLVILMIPIFGMTRMRFRLSCVLGWSIFLTYFTIQTIARAQLDEATAKKWDSQSDIIYQTINYGISVIGGMVSHYRQELLRRRNFALKLPFTGLTDDDLEPMQMDKFRKRSLMRRTTLSFKNDQVEDLFYRHWYLIDPFPFENPNAASLHLGVFRVLRFAVMGLVIDQVILGVQDYKLLWLPGHPVKPKSLFSTAESEYAYFGACIARYGVIVPCYLSMVLFMHWLGTAFYAQWLQKHDDNHSEATHNADDTGPRSPVAKLSTLEQVANVALNVSRWKAWRDEKLTGMLAAKGGYVKYAQWYSAVVIFLHVSCMASLLIWLTRNTHAPQNVYFMGFLNSLLFPHRSGFRIRFVYASSTTLVLAVTFIAVFAVVLAPADADHALHVLWVQYTTYIVVVVILGMFISHEEESLRRTFFILKSMRTLEFKSWFHTVLRVQGWVRAKLKRKLHEIRARRSDLDEALLAPSAPIVSNAAPYMAQASKFGVMSQGFNLTAVLVDVITSSLQS
ncbi:hypothetical protein SDRG_00748 [Saprolegnia diclina VS20]|uniref:Transmembrane protein n=1 Tax=Saprolegnia diclina (strain VS20) TaxID=1156394 RepID=T0SFT3_SAPDV|nr:hypothetical protein SDRG_00748 [Saprolegnia diclina VS20]EQC41892.1 hypothetical protein SDRG_00748 [Saprolegnia diclina VS20]|eukprot:XP_008604461.1 hypothetical protein SDRG_00748 [Saprolegnia diclina VS20]